jgi:hypothetical protein
MAKMSAKMKMAYAKGEKAESSADKKKELKAGMHKMPDGKMMKDSDMKKKKSAPKKKKK